MVRAEVIHLIFLYEKVFIVHGHDGELKQAVARIIEKQGIEAIILSEQANKGRTIIEKFEDLPKEYEIEIQMISANGKYLYKITAYI